MAQDPLSDFRNFLYVIWKHLNLPAPTPVQYDIAHFLQHGPRRFLIEAFRGVGKSWVTSAFVCWQLYLDPQQEILVVSASKNRADDFTTFTMRLIHEVPCLQHLRPRDTQRNSKIAFDVGPKRASHSPSVKSVGITGQLAGSRADLIVADDVEVPSNSATQMMRDKLSEAVKEFDAILKPGGRIGYLGTPQCEQSLYNKLPQRGYVARIWPARIPSENQAVAYGNRLAPMIVEMDRPIGSPTDPKRFSDGDLDEREASYGRSGFALQFMLDTSLEDANRYPLRVGDLVVMSVDNEMAPAKLVWAADPTLVINDLPNLAMDGDSFYRPMAIARNENTGDPIMASYTGSVLAIDPAGRGKDETTYAVLKMLHGNLYCPALGGLKGGYDEETLQKLSALAARYQVNSVVIEANFGDGMFTELLKPVMQKVHRCHIEEVKHSKQKEVRIIDTLEPIMNQHRLVIDPKVIEQDFADIQGYSIEEQNSYSLIYQMTRLTKDRGALRHDDKIDVLAIAAAYWLEQMAQDADKQIARKQETEFDKYLKAYKRKRLGADAINRGRQWVRLPGQR